MRKSCLSCTQTYNHVALLARLLGRAAVLNSMVELEMLTGKIYQLTDLLASYARARRTC